MNCCNMFFQGTETSFAIIVISLKEQLTMLFMIYALKNIDHATYHLTCSHNQTIVSLLAIVFL